MASINSKHNAAIVPEKAAGHLQIISRPTPTPRGTDLLIKVKAIATNPVDYYQRDFGMPPVASYPAVLGSDIAGVVVSGGSDVPSDAPQPGSRVLAFATSYYHNGASDYGSFQEYVLVPSDRVTPIPDNISFEEGSILPMSVATAWAGWTTVGITHDTKYTPADKQAVLIWGGASSVGTAAIQSAKFLGFSIYATASASNHDYLKKLGVDRLFDYKATDVVAQIVKAVREDGVALHTAYAAAPGTINYLLDVLKNTKGDATAKIAYAPPLPPDAPTVEGIETKFVMPPTDPTESSKHFYRTFRVWLSDKLASGEYIPTPHIQVVGEGLESLDKALNIQKAGVSATKLVVKL